MLVSAPSRASSARALFLGAASQWSERSFATAAPFTAQLRRQKIRDTLVQSFTFVARVSFLTTFVFARNQRPEEPENPVYFTFPRETVGNIYDVNWYF